MLLLHFFCEAIYQSLSQLGTKNPSMVFVLFSRTAFETEIKHMTEMHITFIYQTKYQWQASNAKYYSLFGFEVFSKSQLQRLVRTT